MKTTTLLMMALGTQIGNLTAQEPAASTKKPVTKRVAFAQSCFWTGEMKLGQIEGVVRTEAGFFKGREVTLVEYAPDRVALDDLARQAKRAGVADIIHLDASEQRAPAGVTAGSNLDGSYRAAPASDQKKQIEDTPFNHLQLTPAQATKVNAFARENPAKALEWLTPEQRERLKNGK